MYIDFSKKKKLTNCVFNIKDHEMQLEGRVTFNLQLNELFLANCFLKLGKKKSISLN